MAQQELAFSTFAGVAISTDGTRSEARFSGPSGVAIDSAGNVYVADTANHTIRKVTPDGVVSTLAGLAGNFGSADGTKSVARFNYPSGVAVDITGNVYVADFGNNTIRKVTSAGVVSTLAGGFGSAGGTGSEVPFDQPSGVAVDITGNVYVADIYNNTIRKVTPDGVVSTLAGGYGSDDGTGSAAGFYNPSGVAVDSAGNVYVADTLNNTIRKVTPAGVVSTLAGLAGSGGGGSANGTKSVARFSNPTGVAVDIEGNVYVADTENHTIRKVTPAGVVSTVAGLAGNFGSADGTGSAARFFRPLGVAVDSAGNVYVADTSNHKIRIGTPIPSLISLGNIILPSLGTGYTNGLLVKAPTWFPPEGAYRDPSVMPPNPPVLYAVNPYETNLLLTVTWYDQSTNPIVRSYWVEGRPARQVTLGQEITPPSGVDFSRTPGGPATLPPGMAYWHEQSGRLYAKTPGGFAVNWKGTNNNPLPAQVTASWPASANFQIHVAGSPAVDLSGGGVWGSAALLHQEAGGNGSSNDVKSLSRYSNSAPARSLVLLATGSSPQSSDIFFQFLQTVAWNDANYLTDRVPTSIGQSITPAPDWHNTNFGGPFVFFPGSRYNAETNYYQRAIRTGPIIPVNRDETNRTDDDMVLVYYQQGAKLYNPLSGQMTNSSVGWPYKPVRYDCRWPNSPNGTLVIASQIGSGPVPEDNWNIYSQPVRSQPGYNPNEEHAFKLEAQARPLQLDVDVQEIMVLEGTTNLAQVRVALVGGPAPTTNITVWFSSSRSPSNTLFASSVASPSNIVSEPLVFTPANWPTPQYLYFTAVPDDNAVDSVVTNYIQATGALVDQRELVVREGDTNKVGLMVSTLSQRVTENTTRSFTVSLTAQPAGNTAVNVIPGSGPANDSNLVVQVGANLTFTANNWYEPQTVTLFAQPDSDVQHGTNLFRIEMNATGGIRQTNYMTVTEEDTDLPKDSVFALRDDLGDRPATANPYFSEPYVLLKTRSSQGIWGMRVYQVVATNTQFGFTYPGKAARVIQPPYPLSLMDGWQNRSYPVSGPWWQDRKSNYWARSAGDNGGTTNVVMRLFYPVQAKVPAWDFPDGQVHAVGELVPWLTNRVGFPAGVPTDITYNISWPPNTPELRIGETLVKPKFGLPAIAGQVSVDILYQQSTNHSTNHSVQLVDPTRIYRTTLNVLPDDARSKGVTNLIPRDRDGYRGNSVYFHVLPPHLRKRFWYDEQFRELRFVGEFVPSSSLEEPSGYLLMNVITERDYRLLSTNLSLNPTFLAAVSNLSSQAASAKLLAPNEIFDSMALTAGLTTGTGYVTVVFNNAVRTGLLPERPAPVSLEIIRVTTPLYRGDTKVIYSDDPFDEKVTLRHTGDFAGKADNYIFEWEYFPGATKPTPAQSKTNWPSVPMNPATGKGALDTIVQGADIRTLIDNWYRCRYRSTNVLHPAGTDWTAWTEPALVEGWVKRAVAKVGPFTDAYKDYTLERADTMVSMIGLAGGRSLGSVPLNKAAVADYKLLEIYETILKRGIELSIDGNPPAPPNDDVALALLQAAGRIADLYTLLGNEGYADAQDPTIGYGTVGGDYGRQEASSIFCFMGQMPTLLDEELALLRGIDDSTTTDVRRHPAYNRLRWNFNRDLSGGEIAYALNYNLSGGTTNMPEQLAKSLYPQGHGDAWGHYLTAIKNYYRLVRNPNFQWTPESESVTVNGEEVEVNFLHERKFAKIAAAKAKTGAEIVSLTYRGSYLEDPAAQWQGFQDTNTARAWGVSEWASRAGEGAYYDWVLGNALLLPQDNLNTGIRKIDRTTTTELRDVVGGFAAIQAEIDKADKGLNPLGLAKNVVPFGLEVTTPQTTHFDQVYSRAVRAMNSAIAVFNHAQKSTQALRQQADHQEDFDRTVVNSEADFNNELIMVFGYPYEDDKDPAKGGSYPSSYNGPDLWHYMYTDVSAIAGEIPPATYQFSTLILEQEVKPDGSLRTKTNAVNFHLDRNGFGFVKPSHWNLGRKAPGEVQLSRSDLLQSKALFDRSLVDYNNLIAQIEDQAALLEAQYRVNSREITILSRGQSRQESLNSSISRARSRQLTFQTTSRRVSMVANAVAEAFPASTGFIAGTASGVISDFTAAARSAVLLAGAVNAEIMSDNSNTESLSELDFQQAKEIAQSEANIELGIDSQEQAILNQIAKLRQLVRQEAVVRLDLYTVQESMQQTAELYNAAVAKGQRLLEDRLRFRQQTAQQVRSLRYKDMAFRLFRNDALQKYRAQYDLAAMYVYLAASAYDYETALLKTDKKAGARFLTDIVRKRTLGEMENGLPIAGSIGDPGLASVMKQLRDTFDALSEGNGINNPTDANRLFSLRAGRFKVNPGSSGDVAWKQQLRSVVVSNVWDIPEFRRYCRSVSAAPELGGSPVPAIVIKFESAILADKNFFNKDGIGGGYSPSFYANRIKAVGLWLSSYSADPTVLSPTPYAWLVPVGLDVLMPPNDPTFTERRKWQVIDQKLPIPFDYRVNPPNYAVNWIPMFDQVDGKFSLERVFGSTEIRRYSTIDTATVSTSTIPNPLDLSKMNASTLLVGRSVWNTQWLLIIPGIGLWNQDATEGVNRFIDGPPVTPGSAQRTGAGVSDVKLYFNTYQYSGN